MAKFPSLWRRGRSKKIARFHTSRNLFDVVFQVGVASRNVSRIVKNNVYFYKMLYPVRATLSLTRHNMNWALKEIKAACNQPVDSWTEMLVHDWLRNVDRTGSAIKVRTKSFNQGEHYGDLPP